MKDEQTANVIYSSHKAKIAELLKHDANPMFVTLPVACTGQSNGRNSTQANIESTVQQINDNHPDGYGDLADEERAHKTPNRRRARSQEAEPCTILLGAVIKEMDGKHVAFAKGYVMPGANDRREYLRTAKVIVKVPVSFDGWYDKAKKTFDIAKFHLDRVDWSQPGAPRVAGLRRLLGGRRTG